MDRVRESDKYGEREGEREKMKGVGWKSGVWVKHHLNKQDAIYRDVIHGGHFTPPPLPPFIATLHDPPHILNTGVISILSDI